MHTDWTFVGLGGSHCEKSNAGQLISRFFVRNMDFFLTKNNISGSDGSISSSSYSIQLLNYWSMNCGRKYFNNIVVSRTRQVAQLFLEISLLLLQISEVDV